MKVATVGASRTPRGLRGPRGPRTQAAAGPGRIATTGACQRATTTGARQGAATTDDLEKVPIAVNKVLPYLLASGQLGISFEKRLAR